MAVLQVAVGSILTIETSYGGMLVGFMFVSIWTLSLMSLYEAYLQYEAGGPGDFAVRPVTVARSTGGWRMGRKAPPSGRGLCGCVRAPRAAQFQLNPDERWLGLRYARSILALGMAALVVAAAFFLFIPRLWAGRNEWGKNERQVRRNRRRRVSATKCGWATWCRCWRIPSACCRSACSTTTAIRSTSRSIAQAGYAEPLFRGTTLEKYEESTWKGNGHLSSAETKSRRRPASAVRQQILMEPIGTSLLFAIHPVQSVRLANPQDLVQTIRFTQELLRPDTVASDKSLLYDVYSPPADQAAQDLGKMHFPIPTATPTIRCWRCPICRV